MKTINNRPRRVNLRVRSTEKRILLVIGDALAAIFALFIGLYFWAQGDAWLDFSTEFLKTRPASWFWVLPIIWLILLVETYDLKRASRIMDTIRGIGLAALISIGLYLVVYFTSEPNSLPRRGVAMFIIATAVLTLLWRLVAINLFTQPRFHRRVVIVGAGNSGQTIHKVIKEIQPTPYNIIGFIDDDEEKIGKTILGTKVLGGSRELIEIINEYTITDIIFAITIEIKPGMLQAILDAEESGIEVTTMPVVYEELLGRVPILLLDSEWLLRSFIDQVHTGGFYELAKRMIDILGALIGLFVTAVIFPLVAIMILLETGYPIFYFQNRLGKNGAPYMMIKFRSMRKESENIIRAVSHDDPRITRFGRLIRRSHIDEFPQFINVLLGQMSLVGPRAERAELVAALQEVVPFYRARLLVKPGLTGWAQINFGYASSVEDTTTKLEFDLYYIKHRSLIMDIITILRTASSIIMLRGT
jgi:exopolysaccharide biosynthesis polyprenyl glycosylphosphotransferase